MPRWRKVKNLDIPLDPFFEDLFKLANSEARLVGRGCSIRLKSIRRPNDWLWVAGAPYDTTIFSERAFVFADHAMAAAFINRHPEKFKDREVEIHTWAVN
jgi:hypothetical protein